LTYNMNISINLNSEGFNTTLGLKYYTDQVLWGENFLIGFNFTRHEPPNIVTLEAPDEIYIQILNGELEPYSEKTSILNDIVYISQGNYTYTFNTKQFSLIGDTYYFVEITANYLSYVPALLQEQIYIRPLSSSMTIHNYETFEAITKVSEFYNEKVNITVQYCNESLGALKGARLSYDWQFGSGDINPDPRNDNYYTFEIDTGVTNTGTYLLEITAILENYTTQGNYYVFEIKPRTTTINGVEKLILITQNIYVLDPYNFTFEYNDTISDPSQRLGNLDEAKYFWYKLDSGGNPLTTASEDIDINETDDNKFFLDFNTDSRAVGHYKLIVSLEKTNYESCSAIIDLYINLRTIDVDLDAPGLKDDIINVVKGKKVKIEIELFDETKPGEPHLRGAKVVLKIGDEEYEFDEDDPGVYTYTFSTEEFEAFFTSNTLTGEITIKKENYETEELDITIVIQMEEIIEGVPTFYFIMVVSAVAAVVGSLVTYRAIQIARIPKFIKKARAMKKAIKGRSEISESLMTASKEEMIVKIFGDEWDELGISLGDILGIKPKKGKILSESKESMKNEGGAK